MVPFTHFKGRYLFSAFTALLLSSSMLGNAQPTKKPAISDRISAARMAASSEKSASQSNCVLDTELEVTETSLGSPLTGPFKAGEEVTFRYTINEYSALNNGCQWLQGIVPIFGNGWDPNSFQADGRPTEAVDPLTQYSGTWAWYDQDTITYKWDSPFYNIFTDSLSGRKKICYYLDSNCIDTGVVAGEGMPAGWFAYSTGGSPCCESTEDPNVGWGDGASCTTMGGWTVEFTLSVRPFSGPEGCEDTQQTDLSVEIFTFADGQTGCYSCAPQSNNEICAEDVPTFSSFTNQCCQGPVVEEQQIEICSGEETDIALQSDQDSISDIEFAWTVEAPDHIMGATADSASLIQQELINTGDTAGTVIYKVIAVNDEDCAGIPTDISVTVFPELQATAYAGGPVIEGCVEATELALGGNPTATGGNAGPYSYNWSDGLPDLPNPTITPTDSTVYTLTVSDTSGCIGMDEVEVSISSELDLNIVGDTVFCPGDSVLIQQVIPQSGIAPYQIEWDGPIGPQSGDSAIITAPGTYTVDVTDTIGCSGRREVLVTEDDCLQNATVSFSRETPFEIHFSVEFSKSQNMELRWEFGDGSESTEQNPLHTYTDEGNYEVLFIWWNEYSTDTVSLDLQIGTTSFVGGRWAAVHIFPNPSSDQLTVEGAPLGTEISIYDMNGRSRYQLFSVNSSRQKLSLPDLDPGMYILTLTHEGAIERKKLIIQ
jgi:PKD repeat protein